MCLHIKFTILTILSIPFRCYNYIIKYITYGCESWTIKKAECQRIDAFKLWCWRKLLESPLDSKEIKPVHPKRNPPWILIGKSDAEAEAPIRRPPDAKSRLIGKEPYAGRGSGQEVEGGDRGWVVGWHHRLNRQEFEQAPGDSEGRGSLASRSPWGCEKSDMT